VQAFASLSRREQLGRLRRLGQEALARYGLAGAQLRLQRHEHNTTFRVDTSCGTFLLRINRLGLHTPDVIASEMAWLGALRRDTDLGVPEPVAAEDGSFVVVASHPGVPEPHTCVLLRWLDGRFVDRRLAPVHLTRVGALAGQLQQHGARWMPPSGFLRPRVDALTSQGKAASLARSPAAAVSGDHPTQEDADRSLQLVEELVSVEDAALFVRALEVVWSTTRKLVEAQGAFGLIHGDLHYENVLYRGGEACAIDFDDCGWGFHLYDVAVTLSELEGRPRYDELHNALLEAYEQRCPLPEDHATHLRALFLLRRMQMLLWVLESREHAAFRHGWRAWARQELGEIAALVEGG
jgi:Ser/Thr protein kinase RdoA (MazF antagonist)